MDELTRVLSAIKQAEMTSEPNPWIRTEHRPEGGSSAFGPYQITRTMAQDFVDRKKVSPESAEFYRTVLKPMYDKFLKYGAEPNKNGYDPAYDYGGSGHFDVDEYGDDYERLARDMMLNVMKNQKGDFDAIVQRWRGKGSDKRYNREANRAYANR